jgi:hypothetical protein
LEKDEKTGYELHFGEKERREERERKERELQRKRLHRPLTRYLPTQTLTPFSAISRPSIASTVFRVPSKRKERGEGSVPALVEEEEEKGESAPSDKRAETVPSG